MKRLRLEQLYAAILLVVFGGIVIHAPLSVVFGTLFPHDALLIKSWKEILLGIATVLACALVTRRHFWSELAHDWLFRLISLYAVLHIILAGLLYQGAAATFAGMAIDLRYVLFFGLVYVLIRLEPQYRLKLIITAAVGAMVVVGFGTLQLFLPADILSHIGYSNETIAPYLTVDKNHDYIRINSTLRGPNPLGAYAVIVLALITSLLVRAKYRIKTPARRWSFAAVTICSVVVLWLSYSRSALVAALLSVGLVVFIGYARKLSRRNWIIAAAIIGALVGGIVVERGSSFVQNVILHENRTGGSLVSSNDGHAKSLSDGLKQVAHQPIGAGVGSTGSASLLTDNSLIIENQYLFVAHEAGWLGLILYLVIFGLIMVRLWYRRHDWLGLGVFASGLGLAFIGLLLPVWVDDTVSIVWWGLAAIVLADRKGKL